MELTREDIYRLSENSIIEGDEDLAFKMLRLANEKGMDLMDLLVNGFCPGSTAVSDSFERGETSIAEVIYSAEIMKDITDEAFRILGICHDEGAVAPGKPRVLLATVAGDIHDIGRSIVAAFLRVAGFEVIDLGCEVPVEAIASAAENFSVDIIGTSALLTTTLAEQKKLEKYLRDTGVRDKYITMVGGAPCTERWAQKIGADGYSDNAMQAVEVAKELLEKKKTKK